MGQASPSSELHRPSGPELRAEIRHVVQDLPVFLTAPLYRRWHLRWGATAAEAVAELPGDTLVPTAQYRATRAITIDAPASAVWPWLVQVGCLRAGFYSDDLLDNLTRPSAVRSRMGTTRKSLISGLERRRLGGHRRYRTALPDRARCTHVTPAGPRQRVLPGMMTWAGGGSAYSNSISAERLVSTCRWLT